MTLSEIKRFLRDVHMSPWNRDSTEVKSSIQQLKAEAVSDGNENYANALWAYNCILKLQDDYISAFGLMKSGQFYDGWCKLAAVESAIRQLKPHYRSAYRGFWIEFIGLHVERFQSLFPYRCFFSIEAVVKTKTCGICGSKVTLRRPCGHEPGQLYWGEYCYRAIEKIEKLSAISIVQSPADKCCVAFMPSEDGRKDTYDNMLVEYPMSKLISPFDRWDYTLTKLRQPHSNYGDYGEGDECPCESGLAYKDCCLPECGVLRPHYQFYFERVSTDQRFEVLYTRGSNVRVSCPELTEKNAALLQQLTQEMATRNETFH